MNITSSIIYYFLSEKFDCHSDSHKSTNVPVKSVRMYRGNAPEKGYMYIAEASALADTHLSTPGCAFIMLSRGEKHTFSTHPASDFVSIYDKDVDIFSVFENVFDIFQKVAGWDQMLKDDKSRNKSFPEYFLLGEKLLPYPYVMIDRNMSVVAYSTFFDKFFGRKQLQFDTLGISIKLDSAKASEIVMDIDYKKSIKKEGLFLYPSYPCEERYLCKNVNFGKQYAACLAMLLPPNTDWPSAGVTQLFQNFSEYIQDAYLRYTGDVLEWHQNNSLHQLVRTLMFSKTSDEIHTDDTLNTYGWKNDHSYSVIKLQFFEGISWDISAQYICQQLERDWPQSCAVKNDDYIIWIVNLSLTDNHPNRQEFFQTLAYVVRDYACKAGISDTFEDFKLIKSYYNQADQALIIGQSKNPYSWYFHFNNYIIDYMYEKLTADMSPAQLAHKGLLKLVDHDEKNNTEYVKTLKYYIESCFNITHASERLYIHRTTFTRKMDRIKEISGIDFDDPSDLLHLMISYKLLDL